MEAHNLLVKFMRHWPAKLHLVLISRINPLFSIESYRANWMISELGTRELRIKSEETNTY
jgi:ATP/maltotriose-dependent transcriptional regulator MalT